MMKNNLIKLFGGYTKEEVSIIKIDAILEFTKKLYRKGDSVYINDKRYNPYKKYFLLESYNGGNCWYVSEHPNDKTRDEMNNGVLVSLLSHDQFTECPCCFQLINKK